MILKIVLLNYNTSLLTLKNVSGFLGVDNTIVYIIDNNSNKDNVFLLKNSFIADNKQVKLIFNRKNDGFGRTINKWAEMYLENTDYMYLLNNDAFLSKADLSLMVTYLESYRPKLATTGILDMGWGNNLLFFGGHFLGGIPKSIRNKKLQRYCSWASGSSLIIYGEFWNNVGGFDDFFLFGGEDNDFTYRAYKKKEKIEIIPVLVKHFASSSRIHNGMLERKDYWRYYIQEQFILLKHSSTNLVWLVYLFLFNVKIVFFLLKFYKEDFLNMYKEMLYIVKNKKQLTFVDYKKYE